MRHMGIEDGCHEYKCDATTGECDYVGTCRKYRLIPLDSGWFQRVPSSAEHVQESQDWKYLDFGTTSKGSDQDIQ